MQFQIHVENETLWKLAIPVPVLDLVSDTKLMTIDCTYTINYLQKYLFFIFPLIYRKLIFLNTSIK